jgi:hypothetical protein
LSSCIPEIIKTLDLPFQRKNESLPDAKNNDMLALNKLWHEIYEYEGSLIGINYALLRVLKISIVILSI